MSDSPASTYLFAHYGFDNQLQPQLTLQPGSSHEFTTISPRGQVLTLQFDMAQRFCTGWHELTTGQNYSCPDNAMVVGNYDTCRHCQQKTGFNPAFYHATTISAKQQARNAQPHSLYLAHFGPGVIKVGISWAQRGLKRLLDQGARSGLILGTYPTADAAREWEARIARLPGFVETMQVRQKQRLLGLPYDADAAAQELLTARQSLVQQHGLRPDDAKPLRMDPYYIGEASFRPTQLLQVTNNSISGICLGMVGSIYIAQQDDTPFALALGGFTGRLVRVSVTEQPNAHAPAQISLL